MTIKEIVDSGCPVQVMFYSGEGMDAGIMLGDKIICGCCGAVFDVDEVVEWAQEDGVDAIRVFYTWVDISNEIKGDDDETAILASTALEIENGGNE